MIFEQQYEEILAIARDIFAHPELGYKETRTSELVRTFIEQKNPAAIIEPFSTTGLKTELTTDKHKTIAFIAELDAVYAPSHHMADKKTGAAHNCGHYTQVAIALALYNYFVQTGDHIQFDFNVAFIFVPAEEYLDLAYREELLNNGTIGHYGGKPEAMRLGMFDNIDASICIHAIGGAFEKRTVEINCDLAGFLYKYYDFIGEAAHAGFDPFAAKNAYSMSTLFNVALGLVRQQLKDSENVRMNPIVSASDMSTNVIPNAIRIGSDLRTKTLAYMGEVAKKMDAAASGSAHALQGEVAIHTQMGYLPFVQDRYLSTFVKQAFAKTEEVEELLENNAISAAGDIGDLSYMMPCIQIGHSGFAGTIHGDDFIDVDPHFLFAVFPRFLTQVFAELNGAIDWSRLYKRSYDDYLAVIETVMTSNTNL
ncbi:MAG: Carboxypeptidase [Shouchella clausii]